MKAGYAKFETFPIWNLPLNHPVNIAYEAATADLDDVNMIDPFHLEELQPGKPPSTTTAISRSFPVLARRVRAHLWAIALQNRPRTWA